eukprot:scaffold338_cov155-Skeletonema_menzelii.AAC.1
MSDNMGEAKDEEDPLPQPTREVRFISSGGSKSPQRMSLPPRKKSFVDRTARFSVHVSSKDRDVHMNRLLRDKRQSMKILFPDQKADSYASDEEDEEKGVDEGLSKRLSLEEQSEFVRSLQQFFDQMPGGSPGAMRQLPDLEIRLKNFSFK